MCMLTPLIHVHLLSMSEHVLLIIVSFINNEWSIEQCIGTSTYVNKNIKEVDMVKMHFAVSEQKADKD